MLFSEETLNELKWQLKKLSFNAEFIGYDISKILRQNVFGVKKNNLPKDHQIRINSKKDELEEIISDPSDRKFVYLLRDYPYIAGEKYLVTSDSTFFPNDQELKKRLIEYSSKYEFSILSLYDFIKKFFPD